MTGRLAVAALVLMTACAPRAADVPPNATEPDAAHVALAETIVPDDPDLAAIYDRSCRTCHALPGLGAPLAGDSAAWEARRAERGDDSLLASVKSGRNAMPALGYCPDCTDEEFKALIAFMSTEGHQ